MALVVELNDWGFAELFKGTQYEDNFTWVGRLALGNYLEEVSDDIGDIKIDCVSICCEYVEYADISEYNDDYGTDYNSVDELSDNFICKVGDSGFIVSSH